MYRQIVLRMTVALILGSPSHLLAQQDPSLFGWWKLNEGAGTTAYDSSGRGNDGTIHNPKGGLGTANAVWYEDAERGLVASFSGDDTNGAYITTLVKIPFLDLKSDFTWAFWAKQHLEQSTAIPGSGNDVMLGNRYGGTESPLQFVKFTPGKFEFYNDDGSYLMSVDYPDMPGGQWVHCVGVKKGATLAYYRNGVKVGTAPLTKTMDANPFYIGGDPQGERWRGWLSDVRLYERALTEDEIKAMGTRPKARTPDPVNGALGVGLPLLRWTPGDTAILHNIYLGTTPELTEADLRTPRSPMAMYYHAPGLTPGVTYYWRVDEIDKDGVTIHTGDVWSFTAQDVVAYHPSPADKSNEATTSPTLTWLPGQGAAKHQVYFSDNVDAVTQRAAAADKGPLASDTTTFTPPEPLESLTTYYWCVDETVGSTVKAGPVWSFTTSLSVDDFEGYTDTAGSCIFDAWVDGMADHNSGSIVGNLDAPFAEQGIVHSGLQSMPFEYNNVKTPFYSEAVLEFAAAGDWTTNGADTLVLYVRGTPGNKPAVLYVAIEDTSKHSATVPYPDQAITAASKWTQWKIPLSSFTGVNPAKVKKLYLGVGDKENPAAGSAGRIYIDDIRMTKP